MQRKNHAEAGAPEEVGGIAGATPRKSGLFGGRLGAEARVREQASVCPRTEAGHARWQVHKSGALAPMMRRDAKHLPL
jgi:hypothetical protein